MPRTRLRDDAGAVQTSGPQITLGCRTCDLAVVRPVPECFDVRPLLAEFFAVHVRCATYLDLSRASRSVSRTLLVPPQRSEEPADDRTGPTRG